MRRFLFFVVVVAVAIFWAHDFVASGRFVTFLDKTPARKGTATIVYGLARYYEVMNADDRALPLYQRVIDRYPKSRYAMEAQYGVASSYERLKNRPKAMEQYQKFLEMFPDHNKYTESVKNDIDILR